VKSTTVKADPWLWAIDRFRPKPNTPPRIAPAASSSNFATSRERFFIIGDQESPILSLRDWKTTKPPGGGLSLNCRFAIKNSGAGEGIRTLDPDLGKVVLYH
jgi:hypothetical protein